MNIDDYIEETFKLGWKIVREYQHARTSTPKNTALVLKHPDKTRDRYELLACGNIIANLWDRFVLKRENALYDRMKALNDASDAEFKRWGGCDGYISRIADFHLTNKKEKDDCYKKRNKKTR